MKERFFLVHIFGDVDPQPLTEHDSYKDMAEAALKVREDNPDDGIYKLFIDAEGNPKMEAFTGDELSLFINYYECSRCKTEWNDVHSATCDDRCPKCNQTTSPSKSVDY